MKYLRRGAGGFSLLEMLVALAILGLVLGVLYQAATGATRNVAVAERYSFAVLLAESLLADHAGRADAGYAASGSGGGYDWSVSTVALGSDDDDSLRLHRVTAVVSWEGGRNRTVELNTIAPLFAPVDQEDLL